MKKRKKNIEAQPVYDPIVIPGQPHQKQIEYNNETQLSNNLMLKKIKKKATEKKYLCQLELIH
jgi:predicted RNA-binding protein with PUA-like domain